MKWVGVMNCIILINFKYFILKKYDGKYLCELILYFVVLGKRGLRVLVFYIGIVFKVIYIKLF